MIDDQYCGLAVVLDGSEHETDAARWAANWAERSHHHLSLIESTQPVTDAGRCDTSRTRQIADELRFTHPSLTVRHRKMRGAPEAVISAVSSRCTAVAVPRPPWAVRPSRAGFAVPRCPLLMIADESPRTQAVSLILDPHQNSYAPTAFAFAYATSCSSDLQVLMVGEPDESGLGKQSLDRLSICYPSVPVHERVTDNWHEVADHVADSQLVVMGCWVDTAGQQRIDHGLLVSQALTHITSPVALIGHDKVA